MSWTHEWKWLALLAGGFLAVFFLPVGAVRFDNALLEGLHLARWYAREHVLLCLVPALFIAGAISVFVSQAAVMKYLGPQASRPLAYAVASVSGSVLAVCSCTVLPLFGGIYKRGAGLGPASAFLYSGPAVNVLAIILTARVLGLEIGIARAAGAIVFSVVIGLAMHAIFRDEEAAKVEAARAMPPPPPAPRPLAQDSLYFASMIGILVFANWGAPATADGVWQAVFASKWIVTGLLGAAFALMLTRWLKLAAWKVGLGVLATLAAALAAPGAPLVAFSVAVVALSLTTSTDAGEGGEWFAATWEFAKQILPMLLLGVLVAGLLLGRPGHEGLIPSDWVSRAVGGNSVAANLFAAVAGAFMYFATLTEVPILQGLMGSGMGKGPALALLLAGPALSLPSMLVLHRLMGARKTVAYIALVVVMATVSGLVFGALA
ncbi:MAG: permease [Vicinamibacteraceae bacterium]|nr:permease [Vicinamibacteraceae bacterium]